MIKQENANYLRCANMIFERLNVTRADQGGFLMRSFGHRCDQQEYNRILKVLFNLCVNGFLSTDDESLMGWVKLTQKGADYLAGGPLDVNKVDFKQYVSLDKNSLEQFDELWDLIGQADTALFYIKGPVFLNIAKPYIEESIPDYMQYIENRRSADLSTSRRIWYRELYTKIPQEKTVEFLDDLSYAVKNIYYYKENDEAELNEYFCSQLEKANDLINSLIPELPELKIEESNTRKTPKELLDIAFEICNAFKSLVENNRMYQLLYNDDGTTKDETAAQLLFYSIAKGYCEKYDVDINRESNPGIGELDFKFSVGNNSKVVIEMKLSTNSQLYHGYSKQLPAYLRAEDTKKGVLVIIQFPGSKSSQQKQIEEEYGKLKDNPNHEVDVIIVDATQKPSASKI